MSALKSFLFVLAYGWAFGALATAAAQTPATSPDQATYYLGEVKLSLPSGSPLTTSLALAKRVMKPTEHKIIEYVVDLNSREAAREFVAVFEVNGSKFSLNEQSGSFSGDGELVGKPWEWTGWKYTVTIAGGSQTLKGEDNLSKEGIVVKKLLYGSDGNPKLTMVENLKPISKEMYDILHGQVLRK